MNDKEQQKLAKFVAEYIEEDVAVVFNRLHNEATLLGLVTEAVNEYYDRKQLIDRKKRMRYMLSIAREACAGSKSLFTDNDTVLDYMIKAKRVAIELRFKDIEEGIIGAYEMLSNNVTVGGRVDADEILCKMINHLDKEIKDALV